MDDKEKADYYKAHKDDPEVWGDAEGTETESSHRLGSTVTVRLSDEDTQILREMAKKLQLTYSEVLRNALRQFYRPRFSFDETNSNFALAFGAAARTLGNDSIAAYNFETSDIAPTKTGLPGRLKQQNG